MPMSVLNAEKVLVLEDLGRQRFERRRFLARQQAAHDLYDVLSI